MRRLRDPVDPRLCPEPRSLGRCSWMDGGTRGSSVPPADSSCTSRSSRAAPMSGKASGGGRSARVIRGLLDDLLLDLRPCAK
eukprot:2078166-Pyramimonas_sp.AAC.1